MRKISRREAMRGSGGMFHIEPQLTTRKRRIQTLVSHQLSYLFHHEQKQMSYKLLSINSHTNSCLSTLLYLFHNEKIESKQLSYNIFVSTTLSSIFVSSRARWVDTNSCLSILIQTLVYQLSYKHFSLNCDTNSCLSTIIFVSSRARWVETTLIQTLVYPLSYKWGTTRVMHDFDVSRNTWCTKYRCLQWWIQSIATVAFATVTFS